MFLVKRDQVVFPIAYDEGCVIELDFLRGINDSDTPTLEMFASLTVNQMLAMVKRMHTKIANGKAHGRDSLTEYIRDHWNTFRQRLLENGIQTEYHVGKQDIVFFKKNDHEYFPLTISSGFIVDFQNDLENLQRVPFTENMARTMSVAGMERVIEWLPDVDPPRRKMSKTNLASYVVLNFDAFLDNLGDDASDDEEEEDAENSEDEVAVDGNTGISISESKTPSVRETFGGIQAFHVVGFENGMPVMEMYDMDNKNKDDDTNSDISISDLFDDDVPLVIDESYLKDPVDFMEEADKNPVILTIKEPKDDRLLLTINSAHRQFTFDQLKCFIAHVISERPNYDKNNGITKDSFCLLIDGTKHTGADVLAEVIDDRVPVIEMTLMLTLKGGGKKMPSVQKAKKVKDLKIKMDEQKALTSKASSDMSKASGIIDLFVSNAEKNPIEAMKGFLGGNTIANLEAIEEKLGTLNAGGAGVKIRSIASCFFGDVFVKMETEKDEREKMLLLAKSSLEWVCNMAGENDTSLNLMKFRDMIEKAKIFKQGQMASISQPVAVATPMED